MTDGVMLWFLVCCYVFEQVGADGGSTSDGRLPTTLRPSHYNLRLKPDIYSAGPPFPMYGTTVIFFECHQATPVIVLNSVGLTYDWSSLTITTDPDSPVWAPQPLITRHQVDEYLEFLELFLGAALYVGAQYVVSVTYETVLKAPNGGGMYWDVYQENGNNSYIAATELAASNARKVFPSFDEPDYKASFNVSVARKHPNMALSNSEVASTTTEDGWVWQHHLPTPIMSSYLVAVVVGQFAKFTTHTARGTEVNVWCRPERLPHALFANSIAAEVLEFYELWTGIDYPLPKLDHIALPSKSSAMENWGLITYSEAYLLYDSDRDTFNDQATVAKVLAHETAHQWFGNLVTTEWWTDVWLNEGFASYFEFGPMNLALGVDPEEYILEGRVFSALANDDSNTTSEIRAEIVYPWTSAAVIYSRPVYYKGSSILRMVEQILGTATFQRGIQSFLTQFQYDNAVTDDLWAVLTEQADTDGVTDTDGTRLEMKDKMQEWTDQVGYPLIHMTRDGVNFNFTQSVWQDPPGQLLPDSSYGYTWHVPVTLHDVDQVIWWTSTYDWLNRDNKTVLTATPPGWYVVANTKATGFYIVEYDNDNYQLIADFINMGFPVTNRASLIRDIFTLTRAGHHLEVRAMEMTRYLHTETSYLPWKVVRDFFVYQHLVLSGYMAELAAMSAYWLEKTQPLYLSLGWNPDNSEFNNFDKQLQALILEMSCAVGNEDCLTRAHQSFETVSITHDVTWIPTDQRLTVYCAALAPDHPGDWEAALELYLAEEDHLEDRRRVLAGLACSGNTTVLETYIDLTFDPFVICPVDAQFANLAIANSQSGRPVMWYYLKQRWREEPFPQGVSKLAVLEDCASGLSTGDQIIELQVFIYDRYPAESEEEAAVYDRSLRAAFSNQQWVASNRDTLLPWYGNNTSSDPVGVRDTRPGMASDPGVLAFWRRTGAQADHARI